MNTGDTSPSADGREFLAHMGHELRNPLTNILAIAEAVQEGLYGALNAEQQQALGSIGQSVRRALDLVSHAVELGKLETGEEQLAPQSSLVRDFCEAGIELARTYLVSRSLSLITDTGPAGLTAVVDPRLASQVVAELLGCAAVSVPAKGTVGLFVRQNSAQNFLEIRASSVAAGTSGPRVEEPVTNDASSSGLLGKLSRIKSIGLALLTKIVRLHGGSLSLRANSQGGISLLATLALARKPKDQPVSAEPSAREPLLAGPRLTAPLVLVADDELFLRSVIEDHLVNTGYRVRTASDGAEALHIALEQLPDLIIIDMQMPVMNGLEAIRLIRKSPDSKMAQVPILGLSGLSRHGDRDQCLSAGASAYLAKPFGIKEISQAVTELAGSPP